MSKSMKLSAFYEKPELLMKLFGWVSAGVMLFNMVLICCDVFMRYAFNSPIQGTTEIVTMLMAWVAYAGMGYTLLKGQHMQLGAVYELPSEDELGAFGVEGTQNAEKDGDG